MDTIKSNVEICLCFKNANKEEDKNTLSNKILNFLNGHELLINNGVIVNGNSSRYISDQPIKTKFLFDAKTISWSTLRHSNIVTCKIKAKFTMDFPVGTVLQSLQGIITLANGEKINVISSRGNGDLLYITEKTFGPEPISHNL